MPNNDTAGEGPKAKTRARGRIAAYTPAAPKRGC